MVDQEMAKIRIQDARHAQRDRGLLGKLQINNDIKNFFGTN